MRRSLSALLLVTAVALTSACASSGANDAANARGGSRSAPITAEMAREAGASNVYDAVQSLRPTWLRIRGGGSNASQDLVVYLDDTRLGGSAALRQISTTAIVSIEFIDPSAAQFRWGSGHTNGAILVRTR